MFARSLIVVTLRITRREHSRARNRAAMNVTVRLVLFLTLAVVAASSAGILETLLSWDLHETEGRSSTAQSKCLCQTSGCLCCVDLNLTSSIDLGGPACINIKQKEQNVSLNLSYGDNPVHNATIKIENAANKPTCMNLLSDLAQLCAKFTSISRTDQGHNGCLVIEPTLMRTTQATYNIGCFNFNQGVRQIEVAKVPEVTESPVADDEEEEEVGINTEELIAAVSASAEQGIALFSRWLGLSLSTRTNATASNENPMGQSSRTDEASVKNSSSTRTSRAMSKLDDPQGEKSEQERFRQLLSAQDNIVKESARIGQPYEARTKFVYSTPVEHATVIQTKDSGRTLAENRSESLSVVPRESRRGGRAYNIHQHVNEV